ncbi:hypothetical protein PGB90_004374 [Kerria lacca]
MTYSGNCSTINDRSLFNWITSPSFLQMEFFTIAAGNSLAFAETIPSNVIEEQYKTARSISELWLRLSTMVKINETIEYATKEAAAEFTALKNYPYVMQSVFEKIEKKLKEDEELYVKYVDIRNKIEIKKSNAERKVYFWKSINSNVTVNTEMVYHWLNQSLMKKFGVNGDFLYYCKAPTNPVTEPEEAEYFLLAGFVLTMLRNSNITTIIENIYEAAVNETVNDIHVKSNLNKAKLILFTKLNEKLKNIPELYSELETVKRNVNLTLQDAVFMNVT